VKVIPLFEIKSGFPILKNPANRHRAVGFMLEQWHYVFANTFSDERSLELYLEVPLHRRALTSARPLGSPFARLVRRATSV
jgi:hypothetical protein